MGSVTRFISEFWRSFVVILVPLICSPLIFYINTKESRCGYVFIVMGIFWMTEVVPMAMTSLIPVFAFPLLGVMSTDEISYVYMKETNMMFLGGLMVAVAVEHSQLHRRIALAVILRVGQSPMQLMAGFMLTTMFLSMWISNTASAAMMVPIVDAVLQEFYKTFGAEDETRENRKQGGEKEIQLNNMNTLDDNTTDRQDGESGKNSFEEKPVKEIVIESGSLTATPPNEKCRAFRDMFFLATAYGANLGGTGTYTGSGTNLVLKGILQSLFKEETNLNFASWLIYNIPGMVICGALTLIWLRFFFLGCGKKSKSINITPEREKEIKQILQKKYDDLGKMTIHERIVLFWFCVLVLLWLFLAPGYIEGWGSIFIKLFGPDATIGDSTPAMLIVFILFCIPARPNFLCFRDPAVSSPNTSSAGCLTWKFAQEKIPWGVVLLMGGGFAMAKAAQDSGLSLWLGQQLESLNFLPPELMLFLMCIITAMATEITSNAATASIILPVLKDLAIALCINPLFLMLPATLCCSYAFMLPVATPPNAIVFGAANIDSKVMIKAGFIPNILCVLVVTVMINTYADPILQISTLHPWANSSTNGAVLNC